MIVRAALLLTVLALAGCKNNEATVAETNASVNAQLEVINQQTPEGGRTLKLGASPDPGKRESKK